METDIREIMIEHIEELEDINARIEHINKMLWYALRDLGKNPWDYIYPKDENT